MEWSVKTADGRTLAVEDAGDRSGPPVLVHVGTPNSRHLYGRRDESVPFSHGQWLADHIPGVEARFYDNEGHGLRQKHIGEVHAWLAERL